MAGRIRTIKPEIIEDEASACLSDSAWRLWVSTWVIADDHGNLRGEPRRLAADIWWAAETRPDVPALLAELERKGRIVRYEVRGQKYIHIVNWEKHQRIDNAGKPRVPGPDEAEPAGKIRGDSPRTSATRGSDHDHDHREGTPSTIARARVDELSVLLKKKWGSYGTRVILPDALSTEAVARLLVGYAEAAGETDMAALADRAVRICFVEKLLPSWSFNAPATPQLFVKKWDEIQAVLGGLEPGQKPTGRREYKNFSAPRAAVAQTTEEDL